MTKIDLDNMGVWVGLEGEPGHECAVMQYDMRFTLSELMGEIANVCIEKEWNSTAIIAFDKAVRNLLERRALNDGL